MADLSELVQPETKEAIEEDMLVLAAAQGLPTTAWGASSVIRILFAIFATVLARAWYSIAQVANGLILPFSTGAWLTLLARSAYDEERTSPVFTVGTFKLTDNGGGPHGPIAAGGVVVAVGELLYESTGSITIPASGSVDAPFRARAAGSAYNVPNDSTCTLSTSLPTVTVTNPEVGATGTWITTLGADVESDANLQTRLPLKWATLSTGSPTAAYLYWALSTTGVTRAKVDDGNPGGPGTVWVYIDNAGSVAALNVTLTDRRPSGTVATGVAATAQAVTIPGIVTVDPTIATVAEATAGVTANLTELAAEIDIGGTVIQSEVIQRIMDAPGVVDFAMASSWTGSPNLTLVSSSYPQFSLGSLTYVEQ